MRVESPRLRRGVMSGFSIFLLFSLFCFVSISILGNPHTSSSSSMDTHYYLWSIGRNTAYSIAKYPMPISHHSSVDPGVSRVARCRAVVYLLLLFLVASGSLSHVHRRHTAPPNVPRLHLTSTYMRGLSNDVHQVCHHRPNICDTPGLISMSPSPLYFPS